MQLIIRYPHRTTLQHHLGPLLGNFKTGLRRIPDCLANKALVLGSMLGDWKRLSIMTSTFTFVLHAILINKLGHTVRLCECLCQLLGEFMSLLFLNEVDDLSL